MLVLLHGLSEVDDLAVLLLQHVLEISHRGVRWGGGGRELLVDRRGGALERLAVSGEQVESPALVLVDAVTSREAVRLRSGRC